LLDMEWEPAQIPTLDIPKYYCDSTDQALSILPKLVHPDWHQQTQATTEPCLWGPYGHQLQTLDRYCICMSHSPIKSQLSWG
jgi:hypothetical protein